MEYSLNALIILGLAITGIGLASWAMGLFYRYEMPWEVEIVFIGILLMIFAGIAAKILSRMT